MNVKNGLEFDPRGPVDVCMVKGCDGKAIYRNDKRSVRGFCAVHKALASKTTRTLEGAVEWNANGEWRPSRKANHG